MAVTVTGTGVTVKPLRRKNFTHDHYGTLKCSDCSENNCPHIMSAVLQGADSESLFEALHTALLRDVEQIPCWVPLDNSTPPFTGLHCYTAIMSKSIGDMHAAYLSGTNETQEVQDAYFLGFVGPGDGRQVLRNMLDNWLLAHLDDPPSKCTGKVHNVAAQWQFVQDQKTAAGRRLEAWAFFLRETCYYCACSRSGDLSDIVPDL